MAVSSNIPVSVTKDQQLAIIKYASAGQTLLTSQFAIRNYLEVQDRYYMREGDFTTEQTRARLVNRIGDKSKLQNVTVPVVMPQVESAMEYMVNVFLTGYPIFGVSADPADEGAALQMETIIAENAQTARWKRELTMFFRDGLKYNLHAIECTWQEKKVATIETDVTQPNSAKLKDTLWQGNVLKRMDLYNTFFDPRVHPSEIHSEGEFAGYIEIYSRVRMKKYINDMYGKIDKDTALRALQSVPSGDSNSSTMAPYAYYRPLLNPFPIMNNYNSQGMDWMSWASDVPDSKTGIKYTNIYQVMTLYARIIPADFGMKVPSENTPQVWKFIIINGSVVLYAERQTNAHNFLPILFGQPIEDGLDYQTKSFSANVQDMQDIASAMFNGYIAGQRRLVGDRALFDPSRIRAADINSVNPAAKIPVRPSAYGKPVSESVYTFPYNGQPTESLVQGATMITNFANLINGQNPAQQGQFVKGNKTKHEYEDIMGHGNGRNQLMAMSTETQVFTPLKDILKLNILQYQADAVIFNPQTKQQVQVSSTDLRKEAVLFKMSDGLTPTDELMSDDVFQTALQAMMSSPTIAQSYNVAPLFTYLMKQQGADLAPFEKSALQLSFEQQNAAWSQAAAQAAQAKVPFSTPQPQMPQALQQELQAKAQTGGVGTSPAIIALQATVGNQPTVPQRQGNPAPNTAT